MFGVSPRTWATWVHDGRVPGGRRHRREGDGHTCILYPTAELVCLRERIEGVGKPYLDSGRVGVLRVPLKGYGVHREAIIDEGDLPVVEGKSRFWRERSDGTGGEVIVMIGGRQRPLHRLILGLSDRAARVSLVNGDPLDCRRQNLVVRTSAEVTHASRPPKVRDGKARSSTFKGVGFDATRGKWAATIRRGELETTIGEFDDERAAAAAYDDCARVWYGVHAYLNFPDRPSGPEKRAWAEGVLEGAILRGRRRERRVRKLARLLERESKAVTSEAESARGPTIGWDEARRLLGVPRATWGRWEGRGWLTGGRRVGGGGKAYPFAWIRRLLEACGRLRPPYPDPGRQGVWRVPLVGRGTRGKEVLIDASSLPLIAEGWCSIGGARADTGVDAYVSFWSAVTKRQRPLRRLVAGIADEGLLVGHRNGDALDCRRANLVVATAAQRSYRNHKIESINGQPTTSRFKGVSWHRRGRKWTAMIRSGGTARYLGLHEREEDAALAYDRAACELFGGHARLNFPDAPEVWQERAAA